MGESKKKCDHLKKQDASAVDPTKLTALSPEVVRFIYFVVGFESLVEQCLAWEMPLLLLSGGMPNCLSSGPVVRCTLFVTPHGHQFAL